MEQFLSPEWESRFLGSSQMPLSQLDTSAPRFRRRRLVKRAKSEPALGLKCQAAQGRIRPVWDDPRFFRAAAGTARMDAWSRVATRVVLGLQTALSWGATKGGPPC